MRDELKMIDQCQLIPRLPSIVPTDLTELKEIFMETAVLQAPIERIIETIKAIITIPLLDFSFTRTFPLAYPFPQYICIFPLSQELLQPAAILSLSLSRV